MNPKPSYLLLALIAVITSCGSNNNPERDNDIATSHEEIPEPKKMNFNIISSYPHDTSAYTQGLELFNGKMYESTGDYVNSSIRITNFKNGSVEKKHLMGTDKIFGEGITIMNNKIYQLTWQSNIVYVYDINNIEKPIQTFNWPYEGWGITHDNNQLYVSDGTANIYIVDPARFKIKSTISVKDNEGAVAQLNELEYVNGFLFANIYQTEIIVKINPENGKIIERAYLPNLLKDDEKSERTDVLNGIAYDSISKNFFITGQRWPKMFEVKFN
jgi:glutamine cyclotransferase